MECATDEPGASRFTLPFLPLPLTSPVFLLLTLFLFDIVRSFEGAVLFNIESKVDGDYQNLTRSPEDFANAVRLVPLPTPSLLLNGSCPDVQVRSPRSSPKPTPPSVLR